jgi:hypothetical protein
MTMQEYADAVGLPCRMDADLEWHWYLEKPYLLSDVWDSDGRGGRIPPTVIAPDGEWDKLIIDPKPKIENLKRDQPIVVWDNSGPKYHKHFSHAENGLAWTYDGGQTSWTCDHKTADTSPWANWRLPTEEELKERGL